MAILATTPVSVFLQRVSVSGRVVLCLLFLLLAGGVSEVRALPSNNVPLDHWSYGALDKLSGFGLFKSDLHGTRPFTRLEVARLVSEALHPGMKKKLKLPPLIEYFLERFQREFKEELAVYGQGRRVRPTRC